MTTPRPLRLGVIGIGPGGVLHGAVINALPSVELAAVADPSDLVLSLVQSCLPHVATYRDYQELLDQSSLDAVLIISGERTRSH